jgi:hypothetical protein
MLVQLNGAAVKFYLVQPLLAPRWSGVPTLRVGGAKYLCGAGISGLHTVELSIS